MKLAKDQDKLAALFANLQAKTPGVVGAVESRSALERDWRGSCSVRESGEDCTDAFEGFVHGEGVEAGVVNSSG